MPGHGHPLRQAGQAAHVLHCPERKDGAGPGSSAWTGQRPTVCKDSSSRFADRQRPVLRSLASHEVSHEPRCLLEEATEAQGGRAPGTGWPVFTRLLLQGGPRCPRQAWTGPKKASPRKVTVALTGRPRERGRVEGAGLRGWETRDAATACTGPAHHCPCPPPLGPDVSPQAWKCLLTSLLQVTAVPQAPDPGLPLAPSQGKPEVGAAPASPEKALASRPQQPHPPLALFRHPVQQPPASTGNTARDGEDALSHFVSSFF